MIHDLIILFLLVYDSSVHIPDSTLGDQAGFDNLGIEFDWLQGLQSLDELAGSQLGGAPPTCTQEGAGTQLGGSQLQGEAGGVQPGGSQLPGTSGGALQSPGGSQLASASRGLPGASHEVAGSTTAVATPQPTGDAKRRQIHPPDPLTYPREQTHAATQAARLLKKTR
jgi:hypothetical protein